MSQVSLLINGKNLNFIKSRSTKSSGKPFLKSFPITNKGNKEETNNLVSNQIKTMKHFQTVQIMKTMIFLPQK